MTNIRRKVPVLATLALALSLSLPAFGAEAENFVKGKHNELTELVTKAKSAEDQKKLDAAFDAVFDYDGLAKATLKDSWEQRTPSERTEFTTLLKDLVRSAYRRNIRNTLGYEVDYKGEQDGEAGKVVRTIAHNKKNAREEPVSIATWSTKSKGKWLIADIVTEGSSLARNYRNQFRK